MKKSKSLLQIIAGDTGNGHCRLVFSQNFPQSFNADLHFNTFKLFKVFFLTLFMFVSILKTFLKVANANPAKFSNLRF